MKSISISFADMATLKKGTGELLEMSGRHEHAGVLKDVAAELHNIPV